MKRITVLLADDHTVVREGLRALLDAHADIEVVAEAQTGRQAVKLAKQLRPAVVVMDIAMPLLNGLEATRQILKAAPATKILFLSAHSDDEYVDQAIQFGAAGYLIKQTSALRLAKAVRAVAKGETFFSSSIAKRAARPHKVGGVKLTSREVEVLQLVAEGKGNKQTALELGISIKTVEKHRQTLMSKLDIHDTAGLTRYAMRAGVIEGGVRFTIK